MNYGNLSESIFDIKESPPPPQFFANLLQFTYILCRMFLTFKRHTFVCINKI